MKKILFGFLALSTLAITSCTSDDNSTTEATTSQMLVGKWKIVSGIIIEDGETYNVDLKDGDCEYNYYDLKANGSKDEVYHDAEDDCSTENYVGIWAYNQTDNTINTIDTEDNYKMVYEVTEISSNSMKLRLISDNGEVLPEEVEIYSILKK